MPTTTTYNRGAVVLLPFPFSDQTSAKIRPAVIVSPHYPSDDLLAVAVTSVGDALRPGEHCCTIDLSRSLALAFVPVEDFYNASDAYVSS